MAAPTLDHVRAFWEEHPVGEALVGSHPTMYDYFRAYDNVREAPDVEPYEFARDVYGYESSAGKRVLDYGCGNGYVLAQYARNGAEVVGVDITERAIELSRARFGLLGLDGTFVQGDGRSIPFPDESFDVTCSIGVLHHVPEPRPLVAELRRVLKAGGTLVVMLYHRDSFRYRGLFPFWSRYGPEQLRGRSVEDLVRINDGNDNPFGRVYSRDEALELLRDFEDHRFFVNNLGPDELALYRPRLAAVARRVIPRRSTDALARRFGWYLYCVARKP